MVAGSLAAGVGYGLFLLLAAEVLATFSLLRIFLFLSGAMLLGSGHHVLLRGGLSAFRPRPCCAFASAGDAVPAGRLRACACGRSSQAGRAEVLLPVEAVHAVRPVRLRLRHAGEPAGGGRGRHSSASTFILMAVLFATAYFASKRFNIGLLYRSPVVLMVCGFLLVPAESLFGTAASSYLIAISYSLMSFLVMFLLFDIAKRWCGYRGVHGHQERRAVAAAGWWRRHRCAGQARLPASTEALAVTVIVSVLILAATVLLFSEKELASKWGVSILEEGGLVQRTAEEERAAERVEELAHLPPETRGAGGAGASGRGEDRPRHSAGAVYRRGYVQGPHAPHLREDGHQLPQGAVRAAGPFVRTQLQVAADCGVRAGRAAAGCSRGFFEEGEKTVDTAGFALE